MGILLFWICSVCSWHLFWHMHSVGTDSMCMEIFCIEIWQYFLALPDLVVIFTSGTMKSVLKRGHYKEFVTTLKNAVAVGALAIAYLFIIQEGQSFSRMILITTIVIYLILTYAIREIWKNSLHKKMENGGDKKLLIITSKAGSRERSAQHAGKQLCQIFPCRSGCDR